MRITSELPAGQWRPVDVVIAALVAFMTGLVWGRVIEIRYRRDEWHELAAAWSRNTVDWERIEMHWQEINRRSNN